MGFYIKQGEGEENSFCALLLLCVGGGCGCLLYPWIP